MTSSPTKYTELILKEKEELEIRSAITKSDIELFENLVNESNCNAIMNSDLGELIVTTDKENSPKMLQCLLDKGAKINNYNEGSGQTALTMALLLNKDKLATILINNSCGIEIENKDGFTPDRMAFILKKKSIREEISKKIHPSYTLAKYAKTQTLEKLKITYKNLKKFKPTLPQIRE